LLKGDSLYIFIASKAKQMKKEPAKATDKYIVSQSNSLIEADYSQTNLPAKTMKIGRLIISKISPNDDDFRITKISNAAIREYLGYKKNVPYNRFNSDLEDICKRLNDQVIKILTNKGTVINAFFISSWEVDTKRDETTFEISGRLKDYLLHLKQNYTTYQLKNIPKLNSSYSIRMYELLSQYKRIGKRRFELEDLKKKLGCNYDLYGHFKSKALKKAQDELQQYTDIKFDYEESKKGRKVVSILFLIYPNTPKQEGKDHLGFLDNAIEINVNEVLAATVKKQLASYGISDDNIERYAKQGFAIIKDDKERKNAQERCTSLDAYYSEKITLFEKSKTPSSNAAGFLINALKENWKSQEVVLDTKKIARKAEKKQERLRTLELQKQLEQWTNEKQILETKAFRALISDKEKFALAHKHTVKKLGKTYVKLVKGKYANPLEEYQNSKFVSSGIHVFFKENYSESFEAAFALDAKIKAQQVLLT